VQTNVGESTDLFNVKLILYFLLLGLLASVYLQSKGGFNSEVQFL